jgi:PAS domain S-box-containing protein
MVSFAGYPLLVDGQLVGVAAMFARRPLSSGVMEALAAVADEIALGIARKQSEAALIASRDWLSTTLSSIGDAVIATDPHGCVTFMNAVAERMTGWPFADAQGRPLAEVFCIVNEQTGLLVENPVEKVLRDGEVVGLANHTVLIARDGVRRPIDDSAAPIRNAEKALKGVVLVFHDVSERRQAERRAEVQHRVSSALASAVSVEEAADRVMEVIGGALGWPLGLLWTLEPETGLLRVSRVWMRDLSGPLPTEFAATSLERRFRPGEGLPGQVFTTRRPAWVERVENDANFPRRAVAAADGLRSGLAFPLQSDGKTLGVMEFFHTDIRPPDDDMLRTLEGLGHQIGQFMERRRAEEEAIRSGALSSAMLAAALDCVVSMDHCGRVVEWNAEAERTFGYSREEALGQEMAGLIIPPALRESHRAGLQRHLATGEGPVIGNRLEISAVRRDGTEFPVELAISRLAGDPPRFTGFIRDITQRRKTEEEREEARQAAEAAARAKSEFLATMSHEIRTPMNAVIGMTGLLLDTPLSPEQQEYAQVIRDSGDALLTIINDILDFSKIEAGQMEMERQPFDLRDCVESALDLVAARAAERGLDLAYVMSADTPPAVVGDVTRVRQILVNLLSNAVKFTERGEVVLSLSSLPLTTGQYELRFDVRDTGIGIPPDRMDRLFRSFSQVDASTTRRYGGTGLGLAISRRLCDMMGGRIWAESTVGIGSTFHMALPLTISPHAVHPLIDFDQPILEGRRLLIVDDNATNRQILCLQAQTWGMNAVDCATAREALDLLQRGERFDLAILDIQMPDMDGITLASEMNRCCADLPMPLVGLSSVWPRRADVLEAGFAEMLTKPIKQSQLYNVLANVLSARPKPSGAVPAPGGSSPAYDVELGRRLPLRILIAEDLAVNQKLMQGLLAKFGYRADVAGNGIEVLQALKRQPYDVILMDVQMPEMDGLEASRQITHRYGPRQRPRIVALTANAMKEDREVCLAAGMDDYLAKPVKPEVLREALIRCGEWRKGAKAADQDEANRPPMDRAASEPGVQTDVETVRRVVNAAPQTGETPRNSVAASEPPVDEIIESIFLKDLRSMRDILPELLETFQSDVLPRLAAMRVAVSNGDRESLVRAAHGVKGAAGNIGGRRLAELCHQLEEQGRAGSVERADALFPEVEAEYWKLCAALERVAGETS